MTKNEILYGCAKTDEEIFEMDVSDVIFSLRRLSCSLSVSCYNSRIWSYHQRHRLLRLVAELEQLQRECRKWSFHGEKDQLNLPM